MDQAHSGAPHFQVIKRLTLVPEPRIFNLDRELVNSGARAHFSLCRGSYTTKIWVDILCLNSVCHKKTLKKEDMLHTHTHKQDLYLHCKLIIVGLRSRFICLNAKTDIRVVFFIKFEIIGLLGVKKTTTKFTLLIVNNMY